MKIYFEQDCIGALVLWVEICKLKGKINYQTEVYTETIDRWAREKLKRSHLKDKRLEIIQCDT